MKRATLFLALIFCTATAAAGTTKQLENEIARIDRIARTAGYSRYQDTNILAMINDAQRNGDVDRYLQTVIGCNEFSERRWAFGQRTDRSKCQAYYPGIQILSVGDNMILYQHRKRGQFDYADALFMIPKEKGRMYQDGESLDGDFHVFLNMHDYTTAMGNRKTVPVFRRVNLPGVSIPATVAAKSWHNISDAEIARVKAGRLREAKRLDAVAKSIGAKGYKSTDIISLIKETRLHGGLEDYSGYLIGCNEFSAQPIDGQYPACAREYRSVKITQVFDNALFFGSGGIAAFIVAPEPGKTYIEGQRIEDGYFIFHKTHTYETALGSKKTIPVFQRVNIQ